MKTILLVDDEYALVENLTELLQDEGYRVVSAGNGKDGLARAVAEKPDLVLTDLMMPIADGRDLVLGLRSIPDFRSTPIVMMSATVKSVALADGRGGTLDLAAFIAKPTAWEKVLAAVVRAIGEGDKAERGGR
jgi:CheY-like chemotaxis protein